ncbi:MAG: FMN-binding protein [Spirochaetaceae bacterium]|jgi:uncharacterized protein with FMN-binding domain|nr:FMN-binding protein [Spirochaetaceae bacterium]
MKYTITALALCALVSGCAGYRAADGGQGVFTGAAPGFRGPVRVLVRMDEHGIAGIEILAHDDDAAIGGAAMEELLDLALEYNTTDLDAVSGATESSAGFLRAVENARQKYAGTEPPGS